MTISLIDIAVLLTKHILFLFRLYLLNHAAKLIQEPTDRMTTVKLYQHLNTNMNGLCTGKVGQCVEVRLDRCIPLIERNVLFNDALNTFYLRLYGVRHMVKDHSDSEKGNPLPPHRLLLSINSKGSFICTIPQTG